MLFPLDTVILFCSLLEVIVLCSINLSTLLGKGSKKNSYKAVRLTAWVDPPSPEAVRKM